MFRWDFVRGIADNDFTKVVLLIPVAGYLILFNDEIARLASFDVLAGVDVNAPSPFVFGGLAKLRMVFFGSLAILLSYVIYRLFHPTELDVSKNELEFAELVRQRYSVYELAAMEERVHSPEWAERTDEFWFILGNPRSKRKIVSGYRPDVRAYMFREHADYIGYLAREWWAGQMHRYPAARYSSLALGAVGYVLLALPTSDIAQAVLVHLLLQ
ncbi:hypothetical protein [Loktanella sp. IMCC34160]|uniref:hypothetical protein n=1 Tax=Loktanella sp. IMCC34160 TaxID=2510646 RepID=UPI001F5DDA79|nr:hypothetical protein [Loktanella sp. IMCC34160]